MHTPLCFFKTKPLHDNFYFKPKYHILTNLWKVIEHMLEFEFFEYMVDMIPLRWV